MSASDLDATMEPIKNIKYRVGGMDCASCVAKIENAVGRLPGVDYVGVSLSSGTLVKTSRKAPWSGR
jgi:copper chaperone CopZ